jgi:hypothetical protein
MNDYSGDSPVYTPLIGGQGLIRTHVLNPDGIAGEIENQFRHVAIRWASRRRSGPTSPVDDSGGSRIGSLENDEAAAIEASLIGAQSRTISRAQGNPT